MDKIIMSARETFENFMSYVKLFLFLILVGGGGWYYYQNFYRPGSTATNENSVTIDSSEESTQTSESIQPATKKPSELLRPLLTTNLSVLTSELDGEPVELSGNFSTLLDSTKQGRTQPGKMQTAWLLCEQICRELQETQNLRNAASMTLKDQTKDRPSSSSAPRSKAQISEDERKRDFFKKSAAQRWNQTMLNRKKKIDAQFQQLLTAEAAASH